MWPNGLGYIKIINRAQQWSHCGMSRACWRKPRGPSDCRRSSFCLFIPAPTWWSLHVWDLLLYVSLSVNTVFCFCFCKCKTRQHGRRRLYAFTLLGPHVLDTFHGRKRKNSDRPEREFAVVARFKECNLLVYSFLFLTKKKWECFIYKDTSKFSDFFFFKLQMPTRWKWFLPPVWSRASGQYCCTVRITFSLGVFSYFYGTSVVSLLLLLLVFFLMSRQVIGCLDVVSSPGGFWRNYWVCVSGCLMSCVSASCGAAGGPRQREDLKKMTWNEQETKTGGRRSLSFARDEDGDRLGLRLFELRNIVSPSRCLLHVFFFYKSKPTMFPSSTVRERIAHFCHFFSYSVRLQLWVCGKCSASTL